MGKTVVRCALSTGLVAGVLFWGGVLATPSAHAYTTESPEVRGMVKRAAAFLKTASHKEPGGMAVIGMALLKSKVVPEDHPKIIEAFQAVREAVRSNKPSSWNMDIYSTGLSLVFLTSCNPDLAKPEIEILLEALRKVQKPTGGWGYQKRATGDTSMTQYAVLGLWDAKRVGFKPSQAMIDRVAVWLMQTQDPNGAWGYQGKPSKSGLIRQEGISNTMAAAGLGSAYICNDLLGFTPKHKDQERSGALKALGASKSRGDEVVRTRVGRQRLRAAQQLGDAWTKAHYKPVPNYYALYYLYTYERCQSFRALYEGKAHLDPAKHEGPPWYNNGVNYLLKKQKPDGSWLDSCGADVDTGLAVLFLMRSAYQDIAKDRYLGSGEMVAQVGLPPSEDFTIRNNRVVAQRRLGTAESLAAAFSGVEIDIEKLQKALDEAEGGLKGRKSKLLMTGNKQKLLKLLSNPSPDARLAAITALGLDGNLDNAPQLILALEDKDLAVVREARDCLRRLSRKFRGFGLSDDPTVAERRRAADKWRAWYLSIRPDAEF